MRRLTLAVASVVGIAATATAADLPRKAPAQAPMVAPAYSWTGFYVGADVGAIWTRSHARWDPLPTPLFFGEFPIAGDLNETAFIGGLHAGYNWQLSPSWVAGIEVDWSWTDANASFSQPWISVITGVRPGTSTSLSIGPNWLATVRGRVGYLIAPNALLYATGGAAFADVDYSATAVNEPPPTYSSPTSFSKTVPGYVLGGGFEWALWSQWSIRAEYLFYHLNTGTTAVVNDITGNFPPALSSSSFSWSNTELHTFRVGASYRF